MIYIFLQSRAIWRKLSKDQERQFRNRENLCQEEKWVLFLTYYLSYNMIPLKIPNEYLFNIQSNNIDMEDILQQHVSFL